MHRWMIVLASIAALALAGCNTWHGFGKDLEKAGEKIQKSPNN